MQDFMFETQAEQKASATVKVLQKQDSKEFPPIACRSGVLLDGGASHHVYYSSKIPDGSIKKQVELAHGSKTDYLCGEDIIFLDKAKGEPESERPTIISLGRLIKHRMKFNWSKDKAY